MIHLLHQIRCDECGYHLCKLSNGWCREPDCGDIWDSEEQALEAAKSADWIMNCGRCHVCPECKGGA